MKMKPGLKLTMILTSLITTVSAVIAHSGEDGGANTATMMWNDGGVIHNTGHMAGYNMWGMGWYGMIFGLIFWILAALGLIYIYKLLKEGNTNQE